MKRRAVLLTLLALCLLLALALAACGGHAPASSSSPAPTPSAQGSDSSGASDASGGTSGAAAATAPSSGSAPSTPAESYQKYIEMKGNAYDLISGKINDHQELALSAGMALLPVVMTDLALIPLTIIGTQGGEAALSFLGMTGVQIAQNGNTYTITYSDSQGENMTQTCEYDAATDSLQSVISTSGESEDSLQFEYTRCGSGYASQYSTLNKDSNDYTLIQMYFDADNNVAIGIQTVTSEPASIFKQTGLTADFPRNDSSYFLLQGDQLAICTDGATTTY